MPAPEKIKQLIQTFEQNLNEYRTHKNETLYGLIEEEIKIVEG